jgi:hypothetical protein
MVVRPVTRAPVRHRSIMWRSPDHQPLEAERRHGFLASTCLGLTPFSAPLLRIVSGHNGVLGTASGFLKSSVAALEPFRGELGRGR